jgi:hypothetical protein
MATSKQSGGTQDRGRHPINNILDLPNEIISLIIQNVSPRAIYHTVYPVAYNPV